MPGILQERLSQKKENNPAKTEPEYENNLLSEEKAENTDERESYLTEEDLSQLNELDEIMAEENFVAEKKKRKVVRRVSLVLLTVACTYLVVLIYGSFITEFYYDSKGEVAPVVMTVSDISNKNEYNSIVGMYLQTRSLYETLLTLDYRMAAGQEDSMSIAPDYEATLDTISALAWHPFGRKDRETDTTLRREKQRWHRRYRFLNYFPPWSCPGSCGPPWGRRTSPPWRWSGSAGSWPWIW